MRDSAASVDRRPTSTTRPAPRASSQLASCCPIAPAPPVTRYEPSARIDASLVALAEDRVASLAAAWSARSARFGGTSTSLPVCLPCAIVRNASDACVSEKVRLGNGRSGRSASPRSPASTCSNIRATSDGESWARSKAWYATSARTACTCAASQISAFPISMKVPPGASARRPSGMNGPTSELRTRSIPCPPVSSTSCSAKW